MYEFNILDLDFLLLTQYHESACGVDFVARSLANTDGACRWWPPTHYRLLEFVGAVGKTNDGERANRNGKRNVGCGATTF